MLGVVNSWNDFGERVSRFESNLPRIEHGFAFAFINGQIVEAMKKGHWILLDEINLASPETLQGLTGVLDGQALCLTEKGGLSSEAVISRHPDFRVFAAMNPPTDVGKKDLPMSLRCRFTEVYVHELLDRQDLIKVVEEYVGSTDAHMYPMGDIVDIYLDCRALSVEKLVDGAGQRPRYTLRTLTRTLRAAKEYLSIGLRPVRRTLFEGFRLCFLTQLDPDSRHFLELFLIHRLQLEASKTMPVKVSSSLLKTLSQPPHRPGGRGTDSSQWTLVKPFWLRTGAASLVDWSEKSAKGIIRFVQTPSVVANIRDLSAAVSSKVAPILLQGRLSCYICEGYILYDVCL